MPVSISPTQSEVQTALRSFLLSILPDGTEVIEGQDNDVAEPIGPDFVVMTPILRNRLSTNIDDYVDATFTGSIAGTTLTVSDVHAGALVVGGPVYGAAIAPGTVISSFGTGTGGVGTYAVNNAQTVAPGLIASGSARMTQPTQLTVQIDIHGPNSPEHAQIVSTLLRDDYATQRFKELNPDVCPLFAGDPREIPFSNAEQQLEFRWIVDAVLQVNATVIVPGQQFFTTAEITPGHAGV
jgi:hypothetical protein